VNFVESLNEILDEGVNSKHNQKYRKSVKRNVRVPEVT
jgi:hypothetical protein